MAKVEDAGEHALTDLRDPGAVFVRHRPEENAQALRSFACTIVRPRTLDPLASI
jgi:hypothetical protein